ncbi:MAG TPA: hypothetical protein VEA78_10530 [Acidimicrobiales bacterium]|nr:hypothetical protein [Acidimicrobiales bacterium]
MTLLDGPRVEGRRRALVRDPEPDARLVWVLTALAVLPIVVATVRALTGGWEAVGDNANVLIRARDVFTSDHPLLGPWSSATIAIGEHVNQPGPLLFDLLAPFAKLGGSGGVALGVGLLNAASVIVAVVFGRRAAGVHGACVVAASAAALAWTMGSTLLYDPWNPHVVLFPFLVVLACTWAMARGDALALPVAAAVASFVVQTHGSQVFIVPALCAVGVLRLVQLRRSSVVRPVLAAVVVLALCWSQPLVDQIAGEGNLASLGRGLVDGGGGQDVGVERGTRITADVVALPPWWARPSFHEGMRYPPGQPRFVDDQPNVDGLPSALGALLGLAGLAVVVGGSALVARRRGEDGIVAGLAVGAAAVAIALVTTVVQPVGASGLSSHLQRYLWPISALVTLLVVRALVPRRVAVRVVAGLTAVLAVLALPAHGSQVGPAADAEVIPAVRDLAGQLDDVALPEPILVNTDTRYAEPWTSSLMGILQGRGITFTVEDEGWSRQIGTGRRDDGDATAVLFFREGAGAGDVPSGARRVAHHDPLSAEERRELRALEREMADLEVVLNDAGEAALAAGGVPSVAGGATTSALLRDGTLAELVRLDLLELPEDRADDVHRYQELRTRSDRQSIAVFVAPRSTP